MEHMTDYFSPIVFQPQGAAHMDCSNVIAGLWMPRVVQPALEDGAVYQPFRTLALWKELEWSEEDGTTKIAMCEECTALKRQEWDEESRTIWRLMDDWIKG